MEPAGPSAPAPAAAERLLREAAELRSPAFGPGGEIPARFTGAGADVSPPLRWSNPPEGTESFALIMDDHEERIWVHWVLYGIPATVRELPEGVPRQDSVPGVGSQGLNDFESEPALWAIARS